MEFNLTAVSVVSAFGVVLNCILLISNRGRLFEKNRESNCLLLLMFFTTLACLIDPFACASDSQPGALNKFVVVVGNALLYLADMFSTFFWLTFLLNHLKVRLSLTHRYILHSALMLGVAIILVNFFMPIVFEIDENNSYTRQAGYWLYIVIDYGFILDSIIMYLVCRHRGGTMKSFPIALYLMPLMFGTIAQSVFYGISTISSSFTITIAGLMASLQSDRIYTDKMTGIYNYAYLERLEKQYAGNKKHKVSGIMINLNGFKKLNKDYGRKIANESLKNAASIISRAIGELGTVVRFASDEFIAIINTQDEMAINMTISSIKTSFSEFNRDPKNIYKISACFSTANLERGCEMDTFVDILSKRMHAEKIDFYSQGENNRRRA